jgi:hypothetical protein
MNKTATQGGPATFRPKVSTLTKLTTQQHQIMKRAKTLFGMIGAMAILVLAVSCSTTKQTESMLAKAGFKMVSAVTPEQKAHLTSLPPDQISVVERNGTRYYTFPDPAHHVLYVGRDAEYSQYQNLRVQQQLNEQQVNAAQGNSTGGWDAWGGFGGFGWR